MSAIDGLESLCHPSPMPCPLCRARKPRRHCPALNQAICPVCCGTRRQVEIACPADCVYLAAAGAHPPAVVRRQRQRDFEFAAGLFREVSEDGSSLLLALHDAVARHRPATIPTLRDADLAEACGVVAATLETSARGIIYEHRAQSLPAQRLAEDLKDVIAAASTRRRTGSDREAAEILRRIQKGASAAETTFGPGPTAYLDFVDRLSREFNASGSAGGDTTAGAGPASPPAPPSLILP